MRCLATVCGLLLLLSSLQNLLEHSHTAGEDAYDAGTRKLTHTNTVLTELLYSCGEGQPHSGERGCFWKRNIV